MNNSNHNNNKLLPIKPVKFMIKNNNNSYIQHILKKSNAETNSEMNSEMNYLHNSTINPNNFVRTIINPPQNNLIHPVENLGIKKIVSLIVTHNSRMQCLLKELLKIGDQYQKIRFQNCAILRLELQKDMPLSIDLVYEGELTDYEIKFGQSPNNTKNSLLNTSTNNSTNQENNELLGENFSNTGRNALHNNNFRNITEIVSKKKKYYSNHSNISPKILKVQFSINNCGNDSIKICNRLLRCVCSRKNAKPVNFNNLSSNDKYVFYIIRHAEGNHNKMSSFSKGLSTLKSLYSTTKIKDPILTNIGILQAKNAGNNLYRILLENNDNNINYLFVSDLFRTRMTMAIICERLFYNSNLNKTKKQIYIQQLNFSKGLINMIILPCSHEIDYNGKGGPCDGDLISSIHGAGLENTPDIYYDYKNKKVKINKDVNLENIYNNINFSIDNNNKIILSNYTFLSKWSEYLTFNNGIRGQLAKLNRWNNKKQCRTTNMIKNAFNIIERTYENVQNL